MNYSQLLQTIQSKKFSKILVSGPQRSGTTFLSNVLSEDLNYKLHDELKNVDDFLSVKGESVSQAPSMSSLLHKIPEQNGVVVIFVSRNCNDIISSCEKLKWGEINWNNYHGGEIAERGILKLNCPNYLNKNAHSSYIKQNFWMSHQMHVMKVPYINASYDFLQDHPKFKSKDQRAEFNAKQIF
jgi:hypothetical protein